MNLKALFEMATVKMPSKKVMDKIVDAVLYSYLDRRDGTVPKGYIKPKFHRRKLIDQFRFTVDAEDLPYDFGGYVPLILNADYRTESIPSEADASTDDEGDNILNFYMMHPFYMKAKSVEDLEFKIRTNLRHELTHTMQNYLTHEKGTIARSKAKLMPSAYNTTNWQYLTSPTEFEAYIISKIDDFADKNKKGFKTANDLNRAVGKYINNSDFFKAYQKAIDKKLYKIRGTITADPSEEPEDYFIDFPKLRKTAIKKFYSAPEIQELVR